MSETVSGKPVKLKAKGSADRIPLDDSASAIVSESLRKLSKKYPGLTIYRKDFLNWIVTDVFVGLKSHHEEKLYDRFFDEERALAYALSEVRKLKKSGVSFSIDDLLPKKRMPKKRERKKSSGSQKEKFDCHNLEDEKSL